jgi:hypothetical protein
LTAPVIAWETWATIWPEAERLGAAHFKEVEGILAIKRPYRMDAEMMERLEEVGALHLVGARVNGRLIGYCTWTISQDIESLGMLKADQGAIYIDPGVRSFFLGYKMLKFSLPGLRAHGASYVFLHHRVLGRGTRLWLWFKRLGAVLIKHEYYLWIGD